MTKAIASPVSYQFAQLRRQIEHAYDRGDQLRFLEYSRQLDRAQLSLWDRAQETRKVPSFPQKEGA